MTTVAEQTRTQLATVLYRAPARPFTKEQVVAAIAASFRKADETLAWAEPLTPDTTVRAYGRHSHTRHMDDPAVSALELWKRERPAEPFPFTEAQAA